MEISKDDFDHAAALVPLSPAQATEFWRLLQANPNASLANDEPTRRFDAANVAYYFGAVIVMGAMGWFMTNAWETFGGAGMLLIAALYAFVFARVGVRLWRRATGGLRNLGGILVTVAVAMTPLAIYGLQRWIGWWSHADPGNYSGFHEWIKGGWLFMELGTVLAGVIALRFVHYPFLTAPIAFALWYMSMDLTPILCGSDLNSFSWADRETVSLVFGLLMLMAAYGVDVYRRWQGPDYGFWLSLFGLLAFWVGLSLLRFGENEGAAFGYAVINMVLIFVGVALDRRACVVFGALGVNGYLGHLTWKLFADSILFPFALSGFGILVIACGVVYARKSGSWRAALIKKMPAGMMRLLPATARGKR